MDRRRIMTRITGLGLAVSMMLSVFGCAKSPASDTTTSTSDSSASSQTSASETEKTVVESTPEPFYQATELKLETQIPDDRPYFYKNVSVPVFVGDYLIFQEERYFSVDQDEDDFFGDGQVLDSSIFVFNLQGNQLGVIKAPEYWASMKDRRFCTDLENNVVMCLATESDRGNTIRISVYEPNGTMRQDTTFQDPWSSNLVGISVNEAGDYIVVTSSSVYRVDKEGLDVEPIDFPQGEICIGAFEQNGTYYSERMAMQGSVDEYVCKLSGLTPDENVSGDRNAKNLMGMKVFQNNHDVYAMTKNKLGHLDLASGEFSQILDWNQTDIDRSLITGGNVKVNSDGTKAQPIVLMEYSDKELAKQEKELRRNSPGQEDAKTHTEEGRQYADIYVATIRDNDKGGDPVLLRFTKSDTNPSLGKKILWLGGVDLTNGGVSRFVSEYNAREESAAWIKLTDYSDFDTPYDFMKIKKEEVVSQLYKQMLSGVGPDMLFGFADSQVFDRSELLVDLNPYLDGIHGIDRTQYFDNVLQSFCTDGKLYQVPLAFSVHGLFANMDNLEGKENLTLPEILALSKELPEEKSISIPIAPEVFERLYVNNTISEAVNYPESKVNYTSEDILALLEWMEYMQNSDYSYYSQGDVFDTRYLLASYWDEILFATAEISSFQQWADLFSNSMTAKMWGYPLKSESGYTAQSAYSIGLASYCGFKEEAWDFISYLLSQEVQTELGKESKEIFGATVPIPLNEKAFNEMCLFEIEARKLWYPKQENEQPVLNDDPYGMNDEGIGNFTKLIRGISRRYINDAEVNDIILHHWALVTNGAEEKKTAADNILREIASDLRARG